MAGGNWGSAQQVTGAGAGNLTVDSVSCASAGNCAVVGGYDGGSGGQAFVADKSAGSWGTAQEVPGITALAAGGLSYFYSVSCASAGNCAAGGQYLDGSRHYQAFVVDETAGSWGTAQEVPGTATLNGGGFASIESVSCASAGNCSAVGYYTNRTNSTEEAFVVDETAGSWGTAQEVPGTATLNAGGDAAAESVSCTSAGNCTAGGQYSDDSFNRQAFVVDETAGSWGAAQEVPGTATLDTGGNAQTTSVSCTSAGNCSAVGDYLASNGQQTFAVDETAGSWGTAQEIPGTAALNAGNAYVYSVSCASAGNCSAGGSYTNGPEHAFVVDETAGSWGTAQEVPGTATLNTGGQAQVDSVSCASAGSCSAVGTYTDDSNHQQAFVVNKTADSWGNAQEVPGTAALNAGGNAGAGSVSCTSAGDCSAGGSYVDSSFQGHPFVVDYTPAPAVTGLSPSQGPAAGGTDVTITGTNLSGASAVDFGTAAGTIDQIVSPTEITATAPAGSGTVDVTVTTAGGASATTAADLYTYIPPPAVTTLSPVKGPASGGTAVTIAGTNLSGASAVHFGSAAAKIDKLVSATEIKVTAPKGTGTVNVTVTTLGGTSATVSADRYTYIPRPTVTKLSPDKGLAGTIVTITGEHLSGASAVHFGSTTAKIDKLVSATEIKVTAPKDTGTVDVTVTTPGGTSAKTSADRYTY